MHAREHGEQPRAHLLGTEQLTPEELGAHGGLARSSLRDRHRVAQRVALLLKPFLTRRLARRRHRHLELCPASAGAGAASASSKGRRLREHRVRHRRRRRCTQRSHMRCSAIRRRRRAGVARHAGAAIRRGGSVPRLRYATARARRLLRHFARGRGRRCRHAWTPQRLWRLRRVHAGRRTL